MANVEHISECRYRGGSVDFSEEAIIVDHAVGRTKKAIGKCWPMDGQLLTLMKAGLMSV